MLKIEKSTNHLFTDFNVGSTSVLLLSSATRFNNFSSHFEIFLKSFELNSEFLRSEPQIQEESTSRLCPRVLRSEGEFSQMSFLIFIQKRSVALLLVPRRREEMTSSESGDIKVSKKDDGGPRHKKRDG